MGEIEIDYLEWMISVNPCDLRRRFADISY